MERWNGHGLGLVTEEQGFRWMKRRCNELAYVLGMRGDGRRDFEIDVEE